MEKDQESWLLLGSLRHHPKHHEDIKMMGKFLKGRQSRKHSENGPNKLSYCLETIQLGSVWQNSMHNHIKIITQYF